MIVDVNFTSLSTEDQFKIIHLVENIPTKLSEITNEILRATDPLKFKESIYLICSLPNTKSEALSLFWNKITQLQSDEKFMFTLAVHPNTDVKVLEDIYNAVDEINSMTYLKKVNIFCEIANNPNINLKLLILLTKCHADKLAEIVYEKLESYYN